MALSASGCSTSITKEDLKRQYTQGFAEGVIIELKNFRKRLLERVEEYEDTYKMSGHNSICNRISELHEVISMIEKRVYELSPSDCDW